MTVYLYYWLVLPLLALSFALHAETPSTTGETRETIVQLQPKLSSSQLVKALKSGGYILFMRHALTEVGDEETNVDLENCETQRNLSEQGKKQAEMIGSAIKKLAIPIGDVYTSPYCRCVETSNIVFKQATIMTELTYAAHLEPQQRIEYADTLAQLLSVQPKEGTNTIIVSHSVNLQEATGILPTPEGAIYVFKSTGEGYEHVGVIKPDFWEMFIWTMP